MKRTVLLISIIFIFFRTQLTAQSQAPKMEMRGAWIATVLNLDWPSSRYLTTQQQKQELIKILDGLKAAGINTVFFQVRDESDALYNSSYEPWSYWLTGKQGRAPDPFYDPLKFVIEETHKRGMELHAWINPYRAVRDVKNEYQTASNHVTNTHPDWLLKVGNVEILNPGLPQVRDYITKIIMDIVRRYDVDGIHFDDYFYEQGITNQDQSTFNTYSRGFTNLADWRRDNINLFVKEVYDSIQVVKSYVKFGISPPGMYKSGNPPGICGFYGYSDIFADGLHWLQSKTIDYIAPQLYRAIGSSISCGSTDYKLLMNWWSAHTYGRHLYIGQAGYKAPNWSASELPNQIRLNRSTANIKGEILFRTKFGILDNPNGFLDSLKKDYYKHPALTPHMSWKDSVAPNIPQEFRFAKLNNSGISALVWKAPMKASDGDTAQRYVLYNFYGSDIQQDSVNNPQNILDITCENFEIPKSQSASTGKYYFGITAVDRNSNESSISSFVEIKTPEVPILSIPQENALNQRDSVNLKWNFTNQASYYDLQVSSDSNFNSNLLISEDSIEDTSFTVTGIHGLQKYYWRVKAGNITGYGNYSKTFSFSTGFPSIPVLISPAHKTLGVSVNPVITWQKTDSAETYQVQYSESRTFNSTTILYDSTGIADTSLQLAGLAYEQIYFWRVRAFNQYGVSDWSEIFGFQTEQLSSVSDLNQIPHNFSLSQNYPNPFNPATVIKFSIPKEGKTSLKVYNMLGQEVAALLNQNLSAGSYSVQFNGTNLPSGLYIYVLRAGTKMLSRKMILLK